MTRHRLVEQFRRPHGAWGSVAGWIMAHRPSNRARNRWLLDQLAIEPTHRLLEIGYGPGYAVALAAQRAPLGCVLGIDHSVTMQRAASRRNAAAIATGRVELLCGDLTLIDSLPNRFDRIYSANVLQFVSDRASVCLRMRRCLVPGGIAAALFQPRHRGATDDDALRFADTLSQDMRRAGLTSVQILEGPRRPVLSVAVLGHAPLVTTMRTEPWHAHTGP